MPKLWSDTIDAHRREVRDAILDAAARLAAAHGPLNVTMTQVAEDVGIGRATLYRYFSSVEDMLRAWHEQQMEGHLALLADIAGRDAPPHRRLEAVLEAYADIQRHRSAHGERTQDRELAAFLHRGAGLDDAERRLHDVVRRLLAEAAGDGRVRADLPPDELARFCLHALEAARATSSGAAARRVVALVLDALRPR